jgi:hypothetical protein
MNPIDAANLAFRGSKPPDLWMMPIIFVTFLLIFAAIVVVTLSIPVRFA